VRFGGLLLEGAGVRVVCALRSGHAGAGGGCRCKALLKGNAAA